MLKRGIDGKHMTRWSVRSFKDHIQYRLFTDRRINRKRAMQLMGGFENYALIKHPDWFEEAKK